jgi:NitT/TauT family transport system substrate-binding protein
MLNRRRFMIAASLVAPAIISRRSKAETKTVKIATILAGTTINSFLLPDRLKKMGYDAEVIVFPNIIQRMQAVASGDAQIGYGGISAAISIAGRGTPIVVLSNATDGGWSLIAKPGITSIQGLAGKKIATQAGSIQHLCLQWRLETENLMSKTELVFMNTNDMPTALESGDLDGAMIAEPYCSFAEINGWSKLLWSGYDTPMGKLNLAVMAAPDFMKDNPTVIKAVMQAHREITGELQNDKSAAVDAIVKTLNMPRAVAEQSLQNTFFTIESGPGFRTAIEALGKMMIEAKMAQALPDWNTFVQPQI